MEEIITNSTSKKTLLVNDIILYSTTTTRLLFRPLIVNNINNQNACVRGAFISQKKSKLNCWEDFTDISPSKLKNGEYIKLELDAKSVLELLNKFDILKDLYKKHGIRFGSHKYDYIKSTDEEIVNQLSQIMALPNKKVVISALKNLKKEDLDSFMALINITKFKNFLKVLQDNINVQQKEEFWHNVFIENRWALTQIFTSPTVYLLSKPYCGGKNINNIGGVYSDFLYKNSLTNNLVFLEIKTPFTKLIGPSYRDDIYSISNDLTGAVNQIINQRNTYTTTFGPDKEKLLHNIKCYIIIGKTESLLAEQLKSLEIYKSSLNGVEIITYTELITKIQSFIEVFNESSI